MNNLNDIFFAPAANQDLTYDQVLEDVQRYFAENHASTIAEAGEGNAERATTLLKELMVQYIVKRKYAIEGLTTEELCEKLYEDMAGYSFLKKWIYKPGIEEVNINAYNDIAFLARCRHPYVVANAPDDLRRRVPPVASDKDNGLAEFITTVLSSPAFP